MVGNKILKVPIFKGHNVDSSALVIKADSTPDCKNVRIDNPIGALNNNIGMSKLNSLSHGAPIRGLFQLNQHLFVRAKDEIRYTLEGESITEYSYPSGWTDLVLISFDEGTDEFFWSGNIDGEPAKFFTDKKMVYKRGVPTTIPDYDFIIRLNNGNWACILKSTAFEYHIIHIRSSDFSSVLYLEYIQNYDYYESYRDFDGMAQYQDRIFIFAIEDIHGSGDSKTIVTDYTADAPPYDILRYLYQETSSYARTTWVSQGRLIIVMTAALQNPEPHEGGYGWCYVIQVWRDVFVDTWCPIRERMSKYVIDEYNTPPAYTTMHYSNPLFQAMRPPKIRKGYFNGSNNNIHFVDSENKMYFGSLSSLGEQELSSESLSMDLSDNDIAFSGDTLYVNDTTNEQLVQLTLPVIP